MAEDSFEKARKAFFGITDPTPKVSVPLTERLKSQGSPVAEEPFTGPSRGPALDLR